VVNTVSARAIGITFAAPRLRLVVCGLLELHVVAVLMLGCARCASACACGHSRVQLQSGAAAAAAGFDDKFGHAPDHAGGAGRS